MNLSSEARRQRAISHPCLPRRVCCLLALLYLGFSQTSNAQAPPNQSLYERLLGVRESKIDLLLAHEEYQRSTQLGEEGLISKAEVRRTEVVLERAQLNHESAMVGLIDSRPRIVVEEALKYVGADGEDRVKLVISNRTQALPAGDLSALLGEDQPEAASGLAADARMFDASLFDGTLHDVVVSLRDSGVLSPGNSEATAGANIAHPYAVVLQTLGRKEQAHLDFRLLRDVSSVVVLAETPAQSTETPVHLQVSSELPLRILAAQTSLEADLGSSASYDLRFVRSSLGSDAFALSTRNLPPSVSAQFVETVGGSRLSRLTFPPGVNEQAVRLNVFLPQADGGSLEPDQAIKFEVVVAATDARPSVATGESLDQDSPTGVVSLPLELFPRGVGSLELAMISLYSEISVGETLKARFSVLNSGNRTVEAIRLVVEPPLGWNSALVPNTVPTLKPGQREEIVLDVTPSPDAPAGDYEIKLRAESSSYDQRVPTEEKTYRLALTSNLGGMATGVIFLLVLVILCGLTFAGIRLARN